MSTPDKQSTDINNYYLAFSHFQKIGPVGMERLEKFFPDMCQAFFASSLELERAGLRPSIVRDFLIWRKSPAASIENMLNILKKEKISFLTWNNPNYPSLLKEISSPPPVLYYKGRVNDNLKNRLAVVGSRKFSAYGEKAISELLPAIIESNINIISGLALGIDALAHQKALDLEGKTWAVLGSGLDSQNIYPTENIRLAQEIIEKGGALISEFPPGTPPYKQNFPQRNRIISGLSQATMVIESKEKSGALITAKYALEQNREVLSIPGNIFSDFSSGPNKLIQSGAKTILNSEDILETFNITTSRISKNKKNTVYSPETKEEKLIYNYFEASKSRAEKINTDEIARNLKLDTSIINSTLSILEIKGLIINDGTNYELI
ncbi:MAG: DNA-processing protein DprA [Patescibacteria group bacterium]|jgi:DNA processing protein